ncbi:PEP-CTERM domain protein [Oopsacas minuta]|uniref:PEP-CTERM domain protein n=1 Tax=Oopsacas minuta TaxID=111878 RepID=A0AAV7JXS0_9METZ|nr:PEP-CTERM domain protein [Oopsacas minuta]
MATRVAAVGELMCVDELERNLTDLTNHVQIEKEKVSNNFQQLHSLLVVREHSLLQEMDEVVMRARQEFNEKRGLLQELYTASEDLERDLTRNKLRKVLEKNLRTIEDEIREEVARSVNVGWVELDWKMEQLEQSVIDVCKVVALKERPIIPVDYSVKMCPVWSREGTGSGEIASPMQIAIDNKTQNIFVADSNANIIQVFDGEGNHLYKIPTPQRPTGIALMNEFIFVSAEDELVKIEKSSNDSIKSVKTERIVWGIDIDRNMNVYGCEVMNKSVIVFDKNLKFLKRIKLKTTQVKSDTETNSIKLYEDNMYVMFGSYPPFHLQIFSLEGELVRCLIEESEISYSDFFSMDQLGNIIVADWDWGGNQIKIFSNKGEVLHTISSDMLPGDQKFYYPYGVAIDKKNRIIIAQCNKKCNLLAF